jgi:hypothetical protein
MYGNTLQSIADSTEFLVYFRKLPRTQQDMITPHLNEPEQMALRVINSCSELEGQLVPAIASLSKLHQESARAILKVLEGKMVVAEGTPGGKLWRLVS